MRVVGIGNAPVSFGIWEEERARRASPDEPDRFLAAVADTGYAGTELGPPGYLGEASGIAGRLKAHDLRLIGGYLPIRFRDPIGLEADLDALNGPLDVLAAPGHPDTLAILADAGGPALEARPARDRSDRALALDDAAWQRLAEGVARASEAARVRGLVPSFHPHIATHVESAREVERLLVLTDVGITLDTGHMALAGASPTECLRAWADRINHIHVKDVHMGVLQTAKRDGRTDFETWWGDVACPLGEGDAGLEIFFEALRSSPYEGWLVVEQDRAASGQEAFAEIAREQARNLAYVLERIGASGPAPSGSGQAMPTEMPPSTGSSAPVM